jgi:L-alanine-DL-glutamate epimerase-like enolase superfamily enzyme
MLITDVRSHLLTARWAGDPYFPVQLHTTALIEIVTDTELTGVGESMLAYFIPDAVEPIVSFYKPLLIGKDPQRIKSIMERLYVASVYWGRTGAAMSVLSGIDIALWDLKAKAVGVPLYQLLGGLAHDSLKLYCSGGPALWPNERNIEKCKDYVERGYRAVKFATGYYVPGPTEMPADWSFLPTPTARLGSQEGEKCAAVREALGPDIDVILDGHQGGLSRPYSAADALKIVDSVAPYGLLFFEEPLSYTDPAGYAELRRRGKVPIAGGESLSGIFEFRDFFDRQSLNVVQPEITYAGGVSTCLEISADANARNLRMAMHCGGTAGPGLSASAHLSFASPCAIILEHLLHSVGVQHDLLLEPFTLHEGKIAPPTAPGIGVVEITESLLAKYPYIPGTGEVCS